nr:unnamed protein product [Callosobruchus chinensis]
MVYLTKEGILPLGTVRLNRVPGVDMPKEKDMKKIGRGHMVEKVATIDNETVSIVSWFDNKIVNTMSTYAGSEPKGEKRRFFKKENAHKMIPCPDSVLIYNRYMGGVDLLDSMLGFYRIKIRSKKYYLRIFFHFIDMVVVNSWLLARRAEKFDMPLLDTKLAIADSLCKAGQLAKLNKVGRPSNANLQQLYENKRKRDQQKKSPKKMFEKMVLIIYPIGRRQIDQDVNTPAAQERKKKRKDWKVNQRILARKEGRAYMTTKGVMIPRKTVGAACTCKRKCMDHLTDQDKVELMSKLYTQKPKNELMETRLIKRHKQRIGESASHRSLSSDYFIMHHNKRVSVCKSAFMSLYAISHFRIQRLNTWLCARRCKFERENNACPLYKEKFGLRGLVKYEFYFKYFNENYSLRFGRCQVDVCSECERLNAKIKDKNLTVKRVAIAELIVQKRRAKKFYTKLKEIEAICHERPEVMGIAFDYIQNLPLPNISVQEIFYFRELWVYGFKIHNLENNTGHFYTYHEDQALKGPNEVCSFLYDYILNHIPEEITEFPLFSDGCPGQNLMDPKTFYGSMSAVRLPDIESEDSDLSDEDDKDPSIMLAPDSDYDYEELDEVLNRCEQTVISETDSSDDNIPLSVMRDALRKQKKQRPHWIEGNLRKPDDQIQFTGSQDLPSTILELETPLQFFKFLFPDSLIEYITEQTNLYSVQQRPNKPANIKVHEITQFIGITIYMSIIQLPSTRLYWNSTIGHPAVSSVMSCNRFEEIKRFLHFNNNENIIERGQPGYDRLFKIRPFLDQIKSRLLEVPKEEFLAVDEQIVPTKARSDLKQYNPKKPHKWGYKNFVLSGISGFSYDFDLYAGSQSNSIPPRAPDLGCEII